MQRDAKVVLITGAGSGIGAALAKEAARSGAQLVLAGRRAEPLADVADALGAQRTPILVQADVTSAEGRRLVREACMQAGGRIDILFNNAGVVRTGPASGMDEASVRAMIETNLVAPLLLTRDLLPMLRRSKSPRIVNIGSMFGDIAFPLFAVYSATKFGLRGLTDALRRELKPEGIGVTYAAPRAVRTPAAQEFDALVEPFAMKLDAPEKVARRIWRGALKGKRTIYPWPERLFIHVQQFLPTAVDKGLGKQLAAVATTSPREAVTQPEVRKNRA
ncbi:SDR family NAD(P)-dependent oxidoreductase [Parvibaculum sp.]|jgi:short-subunit dehydrogenase|uniref:SDR family NAD(P)-dependent oxidoreductase n=1 Tax=Parvibaculum sp. TaxID=2024848 RepID=UPI002FD87C80